jgi:hypothetical protein
MALSLLEKYLESREVWHLKNMKMLIKTILKL